MLTSRLSPHRRLQGVSIFLSASIPMLERAEHYRRVPEAPVRIEEAVISVARAVFIEGGTIVCGAHPSISPLLARVVGNYYLPAPAEELSSARLRDEIHWNNPSLTIYQSEVWREQWSEATKRLQSHPLVRVEWIPPEGDESVNLEGMDQPQAPLSMERMRRAMVNATKPLAMIAIGGMEGVEHEARIFTELRPRCPIYTLATTGGAAMLLHDENRESQSYRAPDIEAESLVRRFWEQQDAQERQQRLGKDDSPHPHLYVPYAYVAQQIVTEIANNYERHYEAQ